MFEHRLERLGFSCITCDSNHVGLSKPRSWSISSWLSTACNVWGPPKVHLAVDTLGQLLALHVTPADEQDREQVEQLAHAVQQLTGQSIKLAYIDQGCSAAGRPGSRH